MSLAAKKLVRIGQIAFRSRDRLGSGARRLASSWTHDSNL